VLISAAIVSNMPHSIAEGGCRMEDGNSHDLLLVLVLLLLERFAGISV